MPKGIYSHKKRNQEKAQQEYARILEIALNDDACKYKQHLITFAIGLARRGDTAILKEILNKLLPNLKSVKAHIDQESPFRLVVNLGKDTSADVDTGLDDSEDDSDDDADNTDDA